MSEFILVAPGDYTLVDLDALSGATSYPADYYQTVGETGVGLDDVTLQFRALEWISSEQEVVALKYFSETSQLWAKIV